MTQAKATHTPGPWYRAEINGGKCIITRDANNASPIAYVPIRDRTMCEDENNARLMVTSPKMLAALEAVKLVYDERNAEPEPWCFICMSQRHDASCPIPLVTAVIAEAKGETR
jgi:hypothetical protein